MIRYGFLLGVVGTIVCVTANSTLLLPSETTSGANEKSYEDKAVLDVAKFENFDLPDAKNTQNSQMLNEIQDTDDENEDMEINLNTTITEEVLNTKGFASESLNESYVENDGNTNETQNTPTRDLNKSTVQNVVDANEDDEQKDEVQNENEEGLSLGSGKIRKPRAAKPSCRCTEELHRVCGTDGETYPNPCILKCAAKIDKTIQLKHEGPCDSKSRKTRDLKKSYVQNLVDVNDEVQNENKEGQSLESGQYRKPRAVNGGPCPCTFELRRVCGTNGATYSNPCLLKCAAKTDKTIQLKHEGPCDSKSRKTRDLKKSYVQNLVDANEDDKQKDEVQNENEEGQSLGSGKIRKPRSAKPSCLCTEELHRVCGTNGDTYTNPCILKCAAKIDKMIQLKHEGPCDSKSRKTRDLKKSYVQNLVDVNDEVQNENKEGQSLESGQYRKPRAVNGGPCPCTFELRRVCGTNGVTYSNPCLLKCAAKIDKTIQLKHEGPCDSKSRKTRDLKKSYVQNLVDANEDDEQKDEVQNENEEGLSLGSGKIRKPRAAKPSCICTEELHRVCGTNGDTYTNPCILKCAAKIDKTIQLKHEGPCDSKSRKTRDLKKSYVQNLVDVNDEVQNENKEGQSLESGQYRKPRAVNGGPCPCTKELRRVCGTNGVTYSNPCLLKCAAKSDKTIQLKFEGPCDGSLGKVRKTRALKKKKRCVCNKGVHLCHLYEYCPCCIDVKI